MSTFHRFDHFYETTVSLSTCRTAQSTLRDLQCRWQQCWRMRYQNFNDDGFQLGLILLRQYVAEKQTTQARQLALQMLNLLIDGLFSLGCYQTVQLARILIDLEEPGLAASACQICLATASNSADGLGDLWGECGLCHYLNGQYTYAENSLLKALECHLDEEALDEAAVDIANLAACYLEQFGVDQAVDWVAGWNNLQQPRSFPALADRLCPLYKRLIQSQFVDETGVLLN